MFLQVIIMNDFFASLYIGIVETNNVPNSTSLQMV